MRSPEEEHARQLCVRAGNTEDMCDELVFLTPAYQINTPKGLAYGCVVHGLRPLWMCWLDEALSIRHIATEMARDWTRERKT